MASAICGQRNLHSTGPATGELADGVAELGGLTSLDPIVSADVDVILYESTATVTEYARPGDEDANRPPGKG